MQTHIRHATTTLASAAALGLLAGAASAGSLTPPVAEPPVVAPAPSAPSFDWTGGYVGLMGDYGQITNGASSNAWSAGGQAGYNFALGKAVVGGEIAYNHFGGDTLGLGAINAFDAKAKLGYDGGRVMPYVTGGASWVSFGGAGDKAWLVGGGIDYAVTDNVVVGAEVDHRWNNSYDNGSGPTAFSNTDVALKVSYKF
jgi:opacity protein-like surface antigen